METWELLALAAAGTLFAAALLGGLRGGRAAAAAKPPATRPLHRWRRFAVHGRRFELDPSDTPSVLIEEELAPPPREHGPEGETAPKPWRLECERGSAHDLPVGLSAKGGQSFRVERGFLSGTSLLLRRGKAPWLRMTLDPDGELPALRGLRRAPRELPRVGDLELVGSLAEREYEVRLDDRLVASVSWQRSEAGSRAEEGVYIAEVVRSVECAPLLFIIAALEIAALRSGPTADGEDDEDDEEDAEGEDADGEDRERRKRSLPAGSAGERTRPRHERDARARSRAGAEPVRGRVVDEVLAMAEKSR